MPLEKYPDVLSIEDICTIMRIGRNNAYKLLQKNEIPNRKIKRKYIIPKMGLINYLNRISSES